jgi:chorismate mutase
MDDAMIVGLLASATADTRPTLVPLRIATTATADTPAAIADAIAELVRTVHKRNDFGPLAVRIVLFSATADLRAMKPARAARDAGWTAAEYLCLAEMPTDDDVARCIRALVFVARGVGADPLTPVYLRDAASLRP